MDQAQQQGLVRAADRHDFVRNALVLIAPMDAKAPATLKDLAAPGVTRVALSASQCARGRYGKHALEASGLWAVVQPRSSTPATCASRWITWHAVKWMLALLYATDAAIMKDKGQDRVDVPVNQTILYPIARTANQQQRCRGLPSSPMCAHLQARRCWHATVS